MNQRIILAIPVFVLMFMFTSCGRGSDPTSPYIDGDMVRILGANFPKTIASLIAFTRDIQVSNTGIKSRELFIMGPDGNLQKRLTNNLADDDYPAFSPDGYSLAFTSNRASGGYGNHDIWRMNPLGKEFQLTDTAWQFNAHATDYGNGFITAAQINTLVGAPFDVGNVIAIQEFGKWVKYINTGHVVSYDPALGKKPNLMVFCARPNGATYFDHIELYLLVDWLEEPYRITYFGSEINNSDDLVFTRNPQFDRTGTKIIFQTTYWENNWEIGYIDLNTADVIPQPVRLTYNKADDVEPCWDSTGTWFAWATNRDGNFEIYKQRVPVSNVPGPGYEPIRLTKTIEDEHNPDWGPMYNFNTAK